MNKALKLLKQTLSQLNYPANYFNFLTNHLNKVSSFQQLSLINFFIAKLKQNIPPEYLINKAEFMGLALTVNRCTHIPKPLTEILVENFLQQTEIIKTIQALLPPQYIFTPYFISKTQEINPCLCKNYKAYKKQLQLLQLKTLIKQFPKITFLDIGTGSGNIIVSIAKKLPKNLIQSNKIKLIATDTSKCALKVAKTNAKHHSVNKYITFLLASKKSKAPIPKQALSSKLLFILTNPPYIPHQVYKTLSADVKQQPYTSLVENKLSQNIINHARKLAKNNLELQIIIYDEAVLFKLAS